MDRAQIARWTRLACKTLAVQCGLALPLFPQTLVKLSAQAYPTAAQGGVTTVAVTGSGFPAGSIPPANVTVTLQPAAGGSATSTQASGVQVIYGSTERVSFQAPGSINPAVPTSYLVSVAGATTSGSTFSSSSASLTINPAAQIASISPSFANAGVGLQVAITGLYTNFLSGVTLASFGPGISVGGAAAGQPGPVTVNSPTSATAQILVASSEAQPQAVTVFTGAQQASLAGAFTAGPPVVIVGVTTTTTSTIAAGLSGIDDEFLLTGVEYFDPKLIAKAVPLKPGWIRFPGGTPSMAFDWQAGHLNLNWISSLIPVVGPFTSGALPRSQKLVQAKGGAFLSDYANFVKTMNASTVICVNGFTDTNAGSASKMVQAAQADGLNVLEWELANEAWGYPLIFPTSASYAAAMYNPYYSGVTSAGPVTTGLFFQGQFSGNRKTYATWDSGLTGYSPQYWNAASVHVYPITDMNISESDEAATLNGVLAHGTTEYLNSYLLPAIGANTPVFITEFGSSSSPLPFQAYLYSGIYIAEYLARMSASPNVKGIGVVALFLQNNDDSGLIRAVNDFEQYLIDQVAKNPNYSTNTATDPNTQYQFYYSAPALALTIANQAINNSTHIWPTTVTGGPTVPILGYDGNPIPAIFAQGYMGDNGTHYLLITNKSSVAVPLAIEVNGLLLPGTVNLYYVSNASLDAQNTATAQDTVQIMTANSANPITVGPYSVTRVEW